MNEGGADAFANKLALQFRVVSKKQYGQKAIEAAHSCASLLQATPNYSMNSAANPPNALDIAYRCGMIVHLALDHLIKKQSQNKKDLFTFWRELLTKAKSTHGLYSEVEYFEVAARFVPSTELVPLRQLISEVSIHPEVLVKEVLALAGLTY
jgi:predicted metalloprotease with PDZ domain